MSNGRLLIVTPVSDIEMKGRRSTPAGLAQAQANEARWRHMTKAKVWPELVDIEPRLSELHDRIVRTRRAAGRRYGHTYELSRLTLWYGDGLHNGGFKGEMVWLVGFTASRQALRSMRAYDVAYDHLLGILDGGHPKGCGPRP